jgi:hypothetical protein
MQAAWRRTASVLAVCALVTACGNAPAAIGSSPTQRNSPTPLAVSSPVPVVPTESSGVAPMESQSLPGGLVLEAFRLSGPPTLDPLTFEPADGTQQAVLARHADDRRNPYELDLVANDQGQPSLTVEWKGSPLAARIVADPATQEQTAEVWRGDHEVFSAPAGFPSPASALQGLWSYGDHWALEILNATPDRWTGEIYIDGELVNAQMGYDEAFGFQLVDGRPFFFFARGGKVGVNVDGLEADIGFANIPHYECCSGTALNPVKAPAMVAFFAEANDQWWYAEIGAFGNP